MSSSSSSIQGKDNTVTNVSAVPETHDGSEPVRDISGDVIEDGLRRGLKGRQFVIIALGSIIGPGCFYGLGYGIYEAGPLGLLIGFSVVGMYEGVGNVN
jgi:amino acid transporter